MTVVANFFSNILKSIPILLAKIGTVLLLLFTIGMGAGYAVAIFGISPFIFLIPIAAMFIMWYRLDEGVVFLIILTLLLLFFPDVLNTLFSSLI